MTIAAAHTYGQWIEEVPATCTTAGTKGHYHCSACEKNFDADYNEITDLTIAAGHNYGEWIEEVPATNQKEGVKGHYHCDECDKNFDADYNEITDLTIAKKAMNLVGCFGTMGGLPVASTLLAMAVVSLVRRKKED